MPAAARPDRERELISFTAPEFLDYQRGPIWYGVAAGALILLALLGLLTRNLPLAIALILAAGVYFLLQHRPAELLQIRLTNRNLTVGQRIFRLDEIKNFAVIQHSWGAELRLEFARHFRPALLLPLWQLDSAAIRAAFARALPQKENARPTLPETIIYLLRL